MSDDTRLTLRRLHPEHESYATVYDHPLHGRIDVGRISERKGSHNADRLWSWSIGWSGRPRMTGAAEGSAPSRSAAKAAWRRHWPKFRDALSDAEWFDLREAQDFSRKRIDLQDALHKPISAQERAALQQEMARPGATPEWVKTILARG